MNFTLKRGGAVAARVFHRHQVAGSSPAPATILSQCAAISPVAFACGPARGDRAGTIQFAASTDLVGTQCCGWSGLWLRISRFFFRRPWLPDREALQRVRPVCNDLLDEPPAPTPAGTLVRLNGGLFGITREIHG